MQARQGEASRWRCVGPVIPILLGFVLVSLAFNASVPLLEAPDEPSHLALVRFIATRHALPIQHPPSYFPVGQEGSQPPLYYALGAALLKLSPGPALAPTFASHNPFVTFDRSPSDWNNRNLYAHTAQEDFPYRGDVLGIHLVRLLGTILGVVTVFFTFLIARQVFAERPFIAVLAATLVAFNPQFAFISGVVNNDNAITAAATLVLYCLVRWAMRGGSTRLSVALGFGLGSALLAKTDGILLIPFVTLVLLADVVRRKSVGDVASRALLIVVIAVPMAGWWFVRNEVLYGDPLGWEAMLAANGSMLRHPPIDVWAATRVLWHARGTFWGAFGWTNVLYPDAIYRLLDLFSGIAVVGLFISLRHVPALVMTRSGRATNSELFAQAAKPSVVVGQTENEGTGTGANRPERPISPNAAPHVSVDGARAQQRLGELDEHGRLLALVILVALPFAVFASLIRWVQVNVAADQWRLFFPAIASISTFLAIGLDEVWRMPIAVYLRVKGFGKVSKRPTHVSAHELCFESSTWAVRLVPWTITAIGVGINLFVLKSVIAPAFYPTTVPAAVASNAGASEPKIRFGDAIELVGYRVHPARLRSSETLEIDLEWKALRPVTHNWAVSLGVVGDGNVTLAKAQTWPQSGRAPTTAWEPGQIYPDRYDLPLNWKAAQPQLASVWLNLYDASTAGGPSLAVADAAGRPLGTGVVVDRVKLEPTEKLAQHPSHVVDAHFGSEIDLVGFDSVVDAENLRLTLYWRDRAPISELYTVFVHVANADGHVVAQHDGPPHDGAYPTTAWDVGEVIQDQHTVVLKGVPPGRYQVLVGLYRRSTGQRLPVQLANGVHAPNDALLLFDLSVPRGTHEHGVLNGGSGAFFEDSLRRQVARSDFRKLPMVGHCQE